MTTKRFYLFILIWGTFFTFSCKNNTDIDFSLIPVKTGDKWEYIDKNGKIVINPKFKYAGLFHEDLALVKIGNDDSLEVGYIDKDGVYIISPKYISGTIFSEGLACVVPENGYPTYINQQGWIVFTLKDAETASIFQEKLAYFSEINEEGFTLYGFVDKTGEIKITASFYDVSLFSDGLACVKNKEGEWGYIDKEGTLVISYQFTECGDFIDGIALVSNGNTYGYIDEDGKYIINPQFDDAVGFSEDLACVKQGDVWGFIDKEGKYVINPQFDYSSSFSNDLAKVYSSKEYGFIDKEGKFVINPQFNYVTDFYDGIALFKSDKKVGIIDKEGKYIVNPQFDDWTYELYFDYFGSELGDKFVRTDFFDTDFFVTALIGNLTETEFNSFTTSTTLNDVLLKLSLILLYEVSSI